MPLHSHHHHLRQDHRIQVMHGHIREVQKRSFFVLKTAALRYSVMNVCNKIFFLQIFADKHFPQVTDSLPPCLPHEVHGRVHPLHLVVQHLDQDLLHHLHHHQHLPGLCQIRRDNLIRYGHIQVRASVSVTED